MPLSFPEKVVIVFKLIGGASQESIAQELSKSVEEVNWVETNHWDIVEVSHFFNQAQHMPLNGSMYPLMENVLYRWFVEVEQQTNVSTKQLAEKAKLVLNILNEKPKHSNASSFTASQSWINGFRNRFNITIPKRKSSTTTTVGPVLLPGTEREENLYDSDTLLPEELTSFSTAAQCDPLNSSSNTEFVADPDTFDAQDSPTFQTVQVNKSEPDFDQCSNDLSGVTTDYVNDVADDANDTLADSADVARANDVNVALADDVKIDFEYDNLQIDSVFSLADCVRNTDETWQDYEKANDFNGSGATGMQAFIDSANGKSADETPQTNKRKRERPALIIDENSFSDEIGEPKCMNGYAEKKPKLPEKVLVQTRGGLKSMHLKDFNEGRVMRIFMPVLKYARDSGWAKNDIVTLNKLYEKSLQSCDDSATQKTITHFFKKKK